MAPDYDREPGGANLAGIRPPARARILGSNRPAREPTSARARRRDGRGALRGARLEDSVQGHQASLAEAAQAVPHRVRARARAARASAKRHAGPPWTKTRPHGAATRRTASRSSLLCRTPSRAATSFRARRTHRGAALLHGVRPARAAGPTWSRRSSGPRGAGPRSTLADPRLAAERDLPRARLATSRRARSRRSCARRWGRRSTSARVEDHAARGGRRRRSERVTGTRLDVRPRAPAWRTGVGGRIDRAFRLSRLLRRRWTCRRASGASGATRRRTRGWSPSLKRGDRLAPETGARAR